MARQRYRICVSAPAVHECFPGSLRRDQPGLCVAFENLVIAVIPPKQPNGEVVEPLMYHYSYENIVGVRLRVQASIRSI